MITVVVGKGDDKDTFTVAEPLLASASPYFKTALKDTFKEGKNDRVERSEEDSRIFGLVNKYLPQGTIKQITTKLAGSASVSASPSMVDHCGLWCLAHYLQIEALMDYSTWRLLITHRRGRQALSAPD